MINRKLLKEWEAVNGPKPKGWHFHHLKPRHRGGTDDLDNIICVSRELHREIHAALYDRYGSYLDRQAMNYLSGDAYTLSKRDRAKLGSKTTGKLNGMYGRKGKLNPFYGKDHTEEWKTMMKKRFGHPITFRGVDYLSINDAERQTGVSTYLIRKEVGLL